MHYHHRSQQPGKKEHRPVQCGAKSPSSSTRNGESAGQGDTAQAMNSPHPEDVEAEGHNHHGKEGRPHDDAHTRESNGASEFGTPAPPRECQLRAHAIDRPEVPQPTRRAEQRTVPETHAEISSKQENNASPTHNEMDPGGPLT